VRNLLSSEWTEESLLCFLSALPVSEWFNPAHPRIKSGEVQPTALNREEALRLLLNEPLFIRRPLLQVNDERQVGFDVSAVHGWIGLDLEAVGAGDPRNCPCVTAPATPDRYVSFKGINGDGNARNLLAMLNRYIDQPQFTNPFWEQFKKKLALCSSSENTGGRKIDELFLVHSYINNLYDFFENQNDEEALALLARIEAESC
jgi:nitrogenase-associated protein